MTVYANTPDGPVQWERLLAQRTQNMRGSAIRELLKITQYGDVISLPAGCPPQRSSRCVRSRKPAITCFARSDPRAPIQHNGRPPATARVHRRLHGQIRHPAYAGQHPNHHRSQQALDLIAKSSSTRMAPWSPATPPIWAQSRHGALTRHGSSPSPSTKRGCRWTALRMSSRKRRPASSMSSPTSTTPAGTTLPEDRRYRLVEIARKSISSSSRMTPYGALRYEGEDIIPIAAIARRQHLPGNLLQDVDAGTPYRWAVAPQR